jgi:hypothetical protein
VISNWRDYLNQPNPVAAALMAKMRIVPEDRARVKAECLRLLATLQLNPARTQLISGFVDSYLRLSAEEEQVFQNEIGKIEALEQEQVMEIVTSWMRQGIEQGAKQEALLLVLRLLPRRVGVLPVALQARVEALPLEQLEALSGALLDFTTIANLEL